MRKHKNSFSYFFVPFYNIWHWKLIGFVGAIIVILVVCAVFYLPVAKPNIEKQKSIISQIEQNNVDYSYGDVSEFSTHSNAYSQAQSYDGKIVTFTGRVGVIRGTLSGEYGESVISINSDVSDEWCADCGVNDITEADLEKKFKEGDKVTVTGEVYHSAWVIELRNCKIERVKQQ